MLFTTPAESAGPHVRSAAKAVPVAESVAMQGVHVSAPADPNGVVGRFPEGAHADRAARSVRP
ncbi:hypothetical protein MI170_02590 [Mycolicibacterium goodii]|uniref:hypothetical protein n=1 Tax=Mycolicibacterium goodii TaxID=134601 RepID=UPI001F046F81|nr:hypothetical protein [Mycolicibacterium goodii]ULN48298.1 hypothetical protein MI170_02590 [Mycolicibacterium goodii]